MNEIKLEEIKINQLPDITLFSNEVDSHFYVKKEDESIVDSWIESRIGKFTVIQEGMVIYIPERLKRKVLIRNINNYIKEKNLNIKLTNKIKEANSFAVESIRNYYYKTEPMILKEKSTGLYYLGNYWYSYDKNSYDRVFLSSYSINSINFEFYESKNSFSIFGNIQETFNKFDTLKVVDIKDLIDISASVYSDKSVDLSDDIDVSLFEEMMKKEDTCEMLCLSLKNRNITPYLADITKGYYKVANAKSRAVLRNKLLKYYGHDSKFYNNPDHLRNHYFYMKTMRSLDLIPDKEVILEMVGYYD